MTRSIAYLVQTPVNTDHGNRTAPSYAGDSFLGKFFNAVSFLFTAPCVAVDGGSRRADDWLTANIRRNMSPRARRLMRAYY